MNFVAEYIKNEKKVLGIEVDSIFNEEFTIVSATFKLTRDSDSEVVISETAAETSGKEVYYLIDTTVDDITIGKYTAEFAYIVSTEVMIYRVPVSIVS